MMTAITPSRFIGSGVWSATMRSPAQSTAPVAWSGPMITATPRARRTTAPAITAAGNLSSAAKRAVITDRPFLILGRFRLRLCITLDGHNRRAALLKVHHHLQDDGFFLSFDFTHEGIRF